jgi:hypothetical protein
MERIRAGQRENKTVDEFSNTGMLLSVFVLHVLPLVVSSQVERPEYRRSHALRKRLEENRNGRVFFTPWRETIHGI